MLDWDKFSELSPILTKEAFIGLTIHGPAYNWYRATDLRNVWLDLDREAWNNNLVT